MNEFYKLLVMFQTGERVTRHRLLRISDISAVLIDKAVELGYIEIFSHTDDGDPIYIITPEGKQKRDK